MNCSGVNAIRRQTSLIVVKNGQYLSHRNMVTGKIEWDPHLSRAWRTRNRDDAQKLARMLGGRLMLFNPIIWRTKEL
jgi:hypothetical protein